MERKKKEKGQDDQNATEQKKASKYNIHGDAKRSVVAVFLFALSILFGLGFFGLAGVLGEYLNHAAGLLFGWGKWLTPSVLAGIAVVFLYRKETFFYVVKVVGLTFSFLGILGFLHLFFDPKNLLIAAKEGEGGGYIGYAIAYSLLQLTGVLAGSVILGSLFLAGIIIAFNFSLVNLFKKLLISGGKAENGDREKETQKEVEYVKGPEQKKTEEEKEKGGIESKIAIITRKISAPLRKKEKEENYAGSEEFSVSSEPVPYWKLPPLDLLESSTGKALGGDVEKKAEIIRKTFSYFGIEVDPGEIKVGPTITQYSFRPAVGIKLSKITVLSNDLALALAVHPIRIEAPIPGKSLIGVEVPNAAKATVRLRELLSSEQFKNKKSNLTIALGKDVNGNCNASYLQKMPHLMIAGSTGTGKSVCINSILLSLLYQNSPEDLKLILIDPKRVELSLYNGIPHLLTDTIVENGKVTGALKWAISEMERRYQLLQETGSKNIVSYNQKAAKKETRKIVDPETGETREEKLKKIPYIVIVIDELADLMMAHGKEVEGAIIRLAQMARAIGIHLIVSTQRPSVEVLTGLIKANITTRIAFKVATQIDSRTILDAGGAEKLLGSGDMLYIASDSSGLKRMQGVFVSEDEVKKVVGFIKKQKIERGEEEIGEKINSASSEESFLESGALPEKIDFDSYASSDEDPLYEEAKKTVIEAKKASASLLQRRLRVGYARAARILDILEKKGIIGPGEGAKPREVFYAPGDVEYSDPLKDQIQRDKWQI